MRRRLVWLVAATTSVVLLAFLIPLAILVRTMARSSALNDASLVTQALVPVVGLGSPDAVRASVDQAAGSSGLRVTVFLADGTIVGQPELASPAVLAAADSGRASVQPSGAGMVVLQPVLGGSAGTAVIQVRVPASRLERGVARAWLVLALLALGLFGLALLLADRIAVTLLRPLTALSRAAERLESGELSARVVVGGPPEIGEVGHALNRLAARIGQLLEDERESVADLSHRLRTPVTALRLDAESLRDRDEARRIGADVDALERHVDALIREARRPVREGLGGVCDAVVVVEERVRFWSALAEEQDRQVQVELAGVALPVAVGAEDLAAALDAVLGNVMAHTPERTPFAVRVLRRPTGGAVIEVEDDGPGWPGQAVVRRGESGAGSTGLGLDIVDRTARAGGGRLELGSGARGGALVRIELGPPPG